MFMLLLLFLMQNFGAVDASDAKTVTDTTDPRLQQQSGYAPSNCCNGHQYIPGVCLSSGYYPLKSNVYFEYYRMTKGGSRMHPPIAVFSAYGQDYCNPAKYQVITQYF